MNPKACLLLLPCWIALSSCANADSSSDSVNWAERIAKLNGKPLDENNSNNTPQRFAAGTISKPDSFEYGSTFSPDGTLFFFGVDLGHRAEIHVARFENDAWLESEVFLSHETISHNDPMFSPDGKRLYFITDQHAENSFDIGYVEKTQNGWSPVKIATGISTPATEYFYSESRAGEQFFARNVSKPDEKPNFDIYFRNASTPNEGSRLTSSVNSQYYEGDPFISADGNTLIFVSNRPGGAGKGDLYVSVRSTDGHWQPATHLGADINSKGHEITPYLTPDGKALIFSRDGDLYWVSASSIGQ
ncbi:hypothetical protein E2H98_11220 [Permianibacter aggregans]|uniref:WD40 repeat protein n=1 Tax=Permianibacter aggregans TaxID=1510150 RepID=A0A4R6UVD6_9GAMM|nr:hypothetical protein E2H98_11220 [Permianibacter aggregans]TDQ47464.1 WD40 repeat protein [Permianibacter aggregans]